MPRYFSIFSALSFTLLCACTATSASDSVSAGNAVRGGIVGGLANSVTIEIPGIATTAKTTRRPCTGILRRPHWLLTNAHCVISKANFTVAHDTAHGWTPGPDTNEWLEISNSHLNYSKPWAELTVHRHPSYPEYKPDNNPVFSAYDLALVELPKDALEPYSDILSDIIVPSTKLSEAGWFQFDGRTTWDETTSAYQPGGDILTTQTYINELSDNWYFGVKPDSSVHGSGYRGNGGDSGGPVYYQNGTTPIILVGINSGGESSNPDGSGGMTPSQLSNLANAPGGSGRIARLDIPEVQRWLRDVTHLDWTKTAQVSSPAIQIQSFPGDDSSFCRQFHGNMNACDDNFSRCTYQMSEELCLWRPADGTVEEQQHAVDACSSFDNLTDTPGNVANCNKHSDICKFDLGCNRCIPLALPFGATCPPN